MLDIIHTDPTATVGTTSINELVASPHLIAPFTPVIEAVASADLGYAAPLTETEYDTQLANHRFTWNIVNRNDPAWTTSTWDAAGNLPDDMKRKGTYLGRRICPTLDKAGTYDITCFATNRNTGLSSAVSSPLTYIVQGQDAAFTADETFIVAPDGIGTGSPPTNNLVRTTYFQALQDANNKVGITKYRILLKRGFTYDESFIGAFSTTITLVVLGAWGTGSKPLSLRGIGLHMNQDSADDFIVQDIDIQDTGDRSFVFGAHTGKRATAYNCRTYDGATGFHEEVGGGEPTGWVHYVNCEANDFTSSGCLGSGGQVTSWVGCSWRHNPNSRADVFSLGVGGGFGLRVGSSTLLTYVASCDWFIRNGWYVNVPSIATSQSGLRMGYSPQSEGERLIIANCLGEAVSFVAINQVNGSTSRGVNYLVDRCRHIGIHDSGDSINIAHGGVTVRDFQSIRPPSRNAQNSVGNATFETQRFVTLSAASPIAAGSLDRPIILDEVRGISLQNNIQPVLTFNNNFTDVTIKPNCYMHAPYAASPVDEGPFTRTPTFGIEYLGYFDYIAGDTPYYVVALASSTGVPQLGETFIGNTSGVSRVYRGEYFANRPIFDTPVINTGPITVDRFTSGETITGQTSGATITLATTLGLGQSHDSGVNDTDTIPKTVTPLVTVAYNSASAAFTEGDTLTQGGVTGTISQVQDLGGNTGILWLYNVTGGTFTTGSISAPGVTATASSNQEDSHVGSIWEKA